jgi:hypothetical protein
MKLKDILNLNESADFLKKYRFVDIGKEIEYKGFMFQRLENLNQIFTKNGDWIGTWEVKNNEILFNPAKTSIKPFKTKNIDALINKININISNIKK